MFFGVRRDRSGRVLNKRSQPSPTEERRLELVLGALAQWLSLVGQIYLSNPTEVGWDWFFRDYCRPYSEPAASADLRREIREGLLRASTLNVGAVLDAVDAGFIALINDAERIDVVRRAVLPAWQVMSEELAP